MPFSRIWTTAHSLRPCVASTTSTVQSGPMCTAPTCSKRCWRAAGRSCASPACGCAATTSAAKSPPSSYVRAMRCQRLRYGRWPAAPASSSSTRRCCCADAIRARSRHLLPRRVRSFGTCTGSKSRFTRRARCAMSWPCCSRLATAACSRHRHRHHHRRRRRRRHRGWRSFDFRWREDPTGRWRVSWRRSGAACKSLSWTLLCWT